MDEARAPEGLGAVNDTGPVADAAPVADVGAVVRALVRRGETVATVESLTGGLLASRLVDVPGASAAFRGGLVVYARALKHTLAGVPEDLLAARGPVDEAVARALADGGRARCGTHWAVATTGVAGPAPQDGVAPGTVFVAVTSPDTMRVWPLALTGDRTAVRTAAVDAACGLLAQVLERSDARAGGGDARDSS